MCRLARFQLHTPLHASFSPHLVFAAHRSIHRSFPLTSRKSSSPGLKPLVPKDKRTARLSPADATSARRLDTCQAKHRTYRLASRAPTQIFVFHRIPLLFIGVANPPSYALLSHFSLGPPALFCSFSFYPSHPSDLNVSLLISTLCPLSRLRI